MEFLFIIFINYVFGRMYGERMVACTSIVCRVVVFFILFVMWRAFVVCVCVWWLRDSCIIHIVFGRAYVLLIMIPIIVLLCGNFGRPVYLF